MKRRAVIERAIGETRAAVYDGRRLTELHLDRWSREHLPKVGETWTAQLKTIDPSLGGAFVALGEGNDALLPFKAQKNLPHLTEGQLFDVKIAKEAIAEKGPVVRYSGEASAARPGRVEALSLEDRIRNRYPDIVFEAAPVGAHDQATERTLSLPGGGSITLERTQALVAVDVDKGGADRVFDCALQAARQTMAQLRLRGLGGLVVIDFPNLRQPKQRTAVIRTLEEMGEADPASVRAAPFSRFGVVEMTRGQDGPSLDALQNDRFGEPTVETRAIRALRRLTREAKAAPGAQLVLTLPDVVIAWLETAPFDWRAAATERIGARYTVEPGDEIDVRADR